MNRLGVTAGSNGRSVDATGAGERADSSVGVAPPGGVDEGLVVADEGECDSETRLTRRVKD